MKKFSTGTEHIIRIPHNNNFLDGILFIPHNAKSIILFVHGSGSSRLSKRNQYVARELNLRSYATLLFDLLTHEEEELDNQTNKLRFNIQLLSTRLLSVTAWCIEELSSYNLSFGYFGASTGGAAAIVAAAQQAKIKAIVSRGGRPDLAGNYLSQVKAATLLIVGGEDHGVIELNKSALLQMHCQTALEIIPGATHLFEEPGKLSEVASIAVSWFDTYL